MDARGQSRIAALCVAVHESILYGTLARRYFT